MRLSLIFALLISLPCLAQNHFPPIGSWREHLPYQGAIDVTASAKKIYAATPYSLFSVDRTTGQMERISRVAGLSETGISTIRFDPATGSLYIAYSNSNIDVIDEKGIHNIPELKRENISGDKNIYHIFPDGQRVYLSTGLGVIVLDADKKEIRESWFISSNGGYVRTNGFTKLNGFYYAATEEGLKKIGTGQPNPSDFHNWQTISGSNGLAAGPVKGVVNLQDKAIVLRNDSLYVENGSNWSLFFGNEWPVVSMNVSENKIVLSQRQASGAAQVLILNTDGTIARTLQQPGIISFPKNGILVNEEPWIADLFGGLSQWKGNAFEVHRLNSPLDVASGGMAVYNNTVYVTAGSVNDSWNYQYNRAGIYKFSEGWWTNYNQYSLTPLDSLLDFITITIDPRDESFWAGSYGGGLLHLSSTGAEIFKQSSPIGSTIGDPLSYRVSGLAFDAGNNLWISNFGAAQQLHVRKDDGSWQSFTIPFFLNQNAVSQLLVDEANQKWIVSPMSNGLIVFNDNNTIENTADDKWRLFKTGQGQGNLPSNEVLSIAEDKSGFIWVGTSDGIGVIQCPQEIFFNGCETIWPIIKEGAFANYLFKGQEVRSIAVDGADRKWVATSSGVWLVSPDGDKVLAQFTETNSPLLSSDVKTIAINGQTGEVFFATAKGISAFRGSATEAEESKNNVLVFPNPVPPTYNGTIGIRGLPENSIVKITETNGRLLFQARALGGQAVWNGKDYKGNMAASGVYLVLAVDQAGKEKVVGKIVVVK